VSNIKNTNHLNEKHLTDEEVAFCAQQMMADKYPENIPDHLTGHLASCAVCEKEVRDFYHLIADEPEVRRAISEAEGLEDNRSYRSFSRARIAKGLTSSYWRIAVAAAAILILALIAVTIYQYRQVSPEKLFAQYYEPYGDVVTAKSSPDEKILLNGLLHYNLADYDLAIALFISGLQSDPDNNDLRFYLGSSYLAQGSYHDAINNFSMLREKASKYHSPAGWYLALAYLGNDQADEARKMFELIREEGGFYAGNAERILKKLK
jgi:tetratricopeptide (TPR) repeat protein